MQTVLPSNTGSTDCSPHMEVWSWVRKPSPIIIETLHGELWIGVLKITTPLPTKLKLILENFDFGFESRKSSFTHTLQRFMENFHFLFEFQKYRHSPKYVELLCWESGGCAGRLPSCFLLRLMFFSPRSHLDSVRQLVMDKNFIINIRSFLFALTKKINFTIWVLPKHIFHFEMLIMIK